MTPELEEIFKKLKDITDKFSERELSSIRRLEKLNEELELIEADMKIVRREMTAIRAVSLARTNPAAAIELLHLEGWVVEFEGDSAYATPPGEVGGMRIYGTGPMSK